jgi:hypothetical protein
MSNSGSSGSRNPYLRANSLPELLAWDDIDFVRCAYVTVLGRQPDPDGEAYYSRRIREGRSKLQVLWQLRTSNEGPRHDPGIAGFDRALKKARWERGWFGWLIRPFTGGEGDGPSWRRHRILVNALERNTIQVGALQMAPHPSTSALQPVGLSADQSGSASRPGEEAGPPGAQFLTARERMFYLRLQA